MGKLVIKDIELEIKANQGMIPGSVTVGINYLEDEESKWITLLEFEGTPMFFESKESITKLVSEGEEIDEASKHEINEFHGIDLESCDYDEIVKACYNTKGDYSKLIMTLIRLTRLPLDDTNNYIQYLKGRKLCAVRPFYCDVDYNNDNCICM